MASGQTLEEQECLAEGGSRPAGGGIGTAAACQSPAGRKGAGTGVAPCPAHNPTTPLLPR